jgi:hypothetical protein
MRIVSVPTPRSGARFGGSGPFCGGMAPSLAARGSTNTSTDPTREIDQARTATRSAGQTNPRSRAQPLPLVVPRDLSA